MDPRLDSVRSDRRGRSDRNSLLWHAHILAVIAPAVAPYPRSHHRIVAEPAAANLKSQIVTSSLTVRAAPNMRRRHARPDARGVEHAAACDVRFQLPAQLLRAGEQVGIQGGSSVVGHWFLVLGSAGAGQEPTPNDQRPMTRLRTSHLPFTDSAKPPPDSSPPRCAAPCTRTSAAVFPRTSPS